MNIIALLGGVRASIFAGLALLALVGGGVQTVRLSSAQHSLEVQTLALAKSAANFAEWKLKQEAEKAAAVAAIDKKHQEDQQHVQDKADRTIADLRNDVVRLRKRFTCPAEKQPGEVAPPSGSVDGEGEGGLTGEDAEFLIRQAADSDRKALKINALIDIIEEYLKKEK